MTGGITVREIEFGDLAAVNAVNHTAGWPAADPADWTHLWRSNPALDGTSSIARGWVLLRDGAIVGCLINIAQRYQLAGRPLTAAIAASLVVMPECRNSSLQLYLAFVRQKGVDLLLNTTAAPQVSQISEFLKFKRIPQAGYNESFFWPLRAAAFGAAALRKKGFGRVPSVLASPAVGLIVTCEATLRGRRLRGPISDASLSVVSPSQIGEPFDDLWQRASAAAPELLAIRDARTLRWHFAERGQRPAPRVVCAIQTSRLRGYAVIVRQDAGHLGLKRARLADVLCEDDDPRLIRHLLVGALQEARRQGAAMLEVVGFSNPIRSVAAEGNPYKLTDSGWPFLYRALTLELDRALSEPAVWRGCLYDGDGSL